MASRELMEYSEDGTVVRSVYGYNKISETVNGEQKSFFHQNRMGSTAYVTADNGYVLAWTEHDEWGKQKGVIRTEAGAGADYNWLDEISDYTAHSYDAVLDQHFAQYRMYDPINKRFTAEDISKEGLNWYTYVQNNPTTYFDPNGKESYLVRATAQSYGYSVSWNETSRQITLTKPNYPTIKLYEGSDFTIDPRNDSAYMGYSVLQKIQNNRASQSSSSGSSGSNNRPGGQTTVGGGSFLNDVEDPYNVTDRYTGGHDDEPIDYYPEIVCEDEESLTEMKPEPQNITDRAREILRGLVDALDENSYGGLANEIVDLIVGPVEYADGEDYYLGRVIGDIISIGQAAGTITVGISTIATSIIGGGAITVSSAGVLTVGGVTIAVEGVIVGAAEIGYGSAVAVAAIGNFKNDYNNYMMSKGGGSGGNGNNGSVPVKDKTRASNGLDYQSNPKHTPGQPGYRPNAGIEPRNSLDLFNDSVASTTTSGQRYAYDKETGTLHRFFSDGNGAWHWSGSTNQGANSLTSRDVPIDIRRLFNMPSKGW